MITYQRELLSDIKDELYPLLYDHWQEIGVFDKDKTPLFINWDRYFFLEEYGNFLTITARDDEKLVGYYGAYILDHMHYNKTMFSIADVIYIKPEYRKGMIGVRLIKHTEEEAEKMGVRIFIISSKIGKSLSPITKRLGYKPLDMQHYKEV